MRLFLFALSPIGANYIRPYKSVLFFYILLTANLAVISICYQNESMIKRNKTIFNPRYKSFIDELVRIRHKKNLSQIGLAKLSGNSSTFIARTEIRDRRLDLIEAIDLLKAMKLSRAEILKILERLI